MPKVKEKEKLNKDEAAEYSGFTFNCYTLDELPPVGLNKNHEQTLREINKRCKAMYNYCFKNNLHMTDAHMALVLGISKDLLKRWREGKQLNATSKRSRYEEAPNIADLDFIKKRAELLVKWRNMAEMRCLDKVSSDKNAQGSIYVARSSFGLYDNQQTGQQGTEIHVENLILRAEQLRKAGLAPVKDIAAREAK